MTEEEWDICIDPQVMLPASASRVSERKQRLLAAACCRRVESFLEPHTLTYRGDFLGTIERHADAPLPEKELLAVAEDAECAYAYADIDGSAETAFWYALMPQLDVEGCLRYAVMSAGARGCKGEEEQQAVFVRCIFGNPFRPVAFAPVWRTSDVVALARGIYEERAFDRMPILADALQDAGCDNDDVLNHCRADTVHARGCWVVDLVLGKQ